MLILKNLKWILIHTADLKISFIYAIPSSPFIFPH